MKDITGSHKSYPTEDSQEKPAATFANLVDIQKNLNLNENFGSEKLTKPKATITPRSNPSYIEKSEN